MEGSFRFNIARELDEKSSFMGFRGQMVLIIAANPLGGFSSFPDKRLPSQKIFSLQLDREFLR
ncbi:MULTISPECIES: hypothetical protein [Amycolatopsis]|uniref:hypothetical protein n=1 Tax=Amycolatopsis TaxID=1813 RepID=UPI0013BE90EB|nr:MULTISPECIES: hypothetical protein [Amycolatopsis]